MQQIHGTHDLLLVVLSLIIAFFASITALDTARRVHFATGLRRVIWLVSGSAAMGIGIWSMHFIATLAFKLPVPITHDGVLVAVSVIIAIAASLCGLYFSSRPNADNLKLLIGGTIMGIGIGAMHYIGMIAIQGVYITYDAILFGLSIFVAIGASTITLMLALHFRDKEGGISAKDKLVGGTIMGSAIAGIHYIGMAAALFKVDPTGAAKINATLIDTPELVVAVTISTIVIIGLILIVSFRLDKRLDQEIAFKDAILEAVLDCVIIMDNNGQILECNPSVTRTFGYVRKKLLGQGIEKLFISPSSITDGEGDFLCDVRIEATALQSNGEEFPIELTIKQLKLDGCPLFTVYIRDITRFKEAENTIKLLAYEDSLTGLPNRRFFMENLAEAFKKAKSRNTKLAVLFLDLDRFKIINDSMGHTFGDLLLIGVAKRLKKELMSRGIVARNGGDEFTILLENMNDDEVRNLTNNILKSLARPFYLEGQEVYVTISIGIAMYPEDGEDQETLIKNADIAMYEAKANGRNRYAFFECVRVADNSQLLRLENELRFALERNQLVVYYQPRLNIHTGQIIGVEALIRWNHPQKGMIPPDEFIPQAEESGLIIPIGNWVLRTAIAQCDKWRETGLPLEVSVNLSAVQFQKPDIVDTISGILQDENVNPSLLNLEITENMMMDADYSTRLLNELKSLGVTISIDDFGTGFNSLWALKQMPIDHIKIDRFFLTNVKDNPENNAIVKAIISIGHSLELNVIAEGVENKNQLLYLKELGCHEIQGYYVSPPLPAEAFEKWMNEWDMSKLYE
ncbi:bifunctional diguanylate cyclase/phosphodiesterase [Sporosarcina ureilytica]|uniref:Bifunctional diguanylate cyclase/phosphodiesterase n=1 Tax=Sporosarcina ureilytica TaxID=298596 RepID=A0A1D8JDC4_9BACL|nr:EAL domain-containing protein [Sporosarcina ureilytica]AOV06710.1 hypothetical protein BI350_03270 [Sporosarcina ureilytica]